MSHFNLNWGVEQLHPINENDFLHPNAHSWCPIYLFIYLAAASQTAWAGQKGEKKRAQAGW